MSNGAHGMIIVNLDRLLSERKMQSAELAKRLGCTVQTVSRIKTGKARAFRVDMLDALCAEFGCQPGDVLEYVSEEEAVQRFGTEFVESYKETHDIA